MDFEQMKIDPNELERIMELIESYTVKQKKVLEDMISSMKKLSYEWDDDKGFGEMLRHIETVDKRAIEVFEQIRVVYKRFYYDEVLDIRKNLASLKV